MTFIPPIHELERPLAGLGYQFWSGVEGALQAAAEHLAYFVLAVALWLYHHNCHVKGCWRLQWHTHPSNGHPVCKHHHPHHPAGAGGGHKDLEP